LCLAPPPPPSLSLLGGVGDGAGGERAAHVGIAEGGNGSEREGGRGYGDGDREGDGECGGAGAVAGDGEEKKRKENNIQNEGTNAVLRESDACIAAADTHLRSLLRRFPRLLRALTTRQLAMKVLATQRLHAERMVHSGLVTAHHGLARSRATDRSLERLIGGAVNMSHAGEP
jgi:hypothetical protein